MRWFFNKKSTALNFLLNQDTADPSVFHAGQLFDVYRSDPAVYACVSEIATTVGGIRIHAVEPDGQFLETHPLDSLLTAPAPGISGAAFRRRLTTNYLIFGAAYILRVGGSDLARPPRELWVLNPTSVKRLADANGVTTGWDYRPTAAGLVKYLPEQVCAIGQFDTAGLPVSPLAAVMTSVRTAEQARKWNYNLLRQGARPSGALRVKTPLPEQARARLREDLRSSYQGSAGAGNVLVLEGDLEWQQMSYSPADLEWRENLRMATVDVCRVFNVPPEMIGDSQNKTYSNYQEARKAFYHETVLPLLDQICESLTGWLSNLYGGVGVGYNANGIEALVEDRAAVYDRILKAVDAGVLTVNEARRELGLEPVAGGDTGLVAANRLPLDVVAGGIAVESEAGL